MAKSSADLAATIGVMLDGKDFTQDLTYSWKDLHVGFVDAALWEFDPAICDPDPILKEQQDLAYAEAREQIMQADGRVEYPVPLPSMNDLYLDGEDALELLWSSLSLPESLCPTNYLT